MKLVFSQVFPPAKGGSGRWLFEAYSRFPERSCIMLVGQCESTITLDQDYPQTILRRNLTVVDRSFFSLKSLHAYFRVFHILFTAIREHKVTELHAARPLHEGLTAALLSLFVRIRIVLFVHGEDVNIATTSRKLRWITSFALSRANLIITNSNFSRGLLLEDWSVPSSKIRVVHPGVDTDFFKPSDNPKKSGDPLRILTVGRLQKRKGHDAFIRALAEIVTSHPNVDYRIVGSGEEQANLEELVKELHLTKQVQLLGEMDDSQLLKEYQSCDLFVLPNRSIGKDIEGFGMVLLEAQACGKPVIAGSSGGTAETLQFGVTGFTVDCSDRVALIKRIEQFIIAPELLSTMGLAAQKWVRDRFSWEYSVKKLAISLLNSNSGDTDRN